MSLALCVFTLLLPVAADAPKLDVLNISSAYSGKYLVQGARKVNLSLFLGKDGNGSGTLFLDPNFTNGFMSTCMAGETYSVQAQLVQSDEQAAKGGRLYELKLKGDEGKVEKKPRWFLIRPIKEGSPSLLVFADENGKFTDVLTMQ
jgi:hypothetical protein